MQPADLNPASGPAAAPGHTDSASGCVQQSAAAGAGCGERGENLPAGWDTAWIDLGGEG